MDVSGVSTGDLGQDHAEMMRRLLIMNDVNMEGPNPFTAKVHAAVAAVVEATRDRMPLASDFRRPGFRQWSKARS